MKKSYSTDLSDAEAKGEEYMANGSYTGPLTVVKD